MPLERHVQVLADELQVVATMDVGEMWDRMLGEFLGHWEESTRQGLAGSALDAEMDAFMTDLSERPVRDLARTGAGVSYNQGRAAEILSEFDSKDLDFVIRSEVLDGRTCQSCANLDSAIFEVGTPEFQEFMPPAKCEGGDRCRGFYVPVSGNGVFS